MFEAPEQFDITRSPNPHLGFGGTGAHYCVGANLARLEIDLIFNAIADAMPSIRKSGDAERLRSGWLNGIKQAPGQLRLIAPQSGVSATTHIEKYCEPPP